jgi:hypothetical protein
MLNVLQITVETFKGSNFADLIVHDDYSLMEVHKIELDKLDFYLSGYDENVAMTHNVYVDNYLFTSITEPVKMFLQGSEY